MIGSQFGAFQITICGVDQLDLHSAAGVTHLLSILDPAEPQPRTLRVIAPYHSLELRFHDVIAPEAGAIPPELEHVEQLLAFGRDVMASGPDAHLLVHCHAGVSRSTAAAALCLAQAYPTRSAYETLGEVARLRSGAWPNLRMIELGDIVLGRQGELIAAAGALYRRMLDAQPELGGRMSRRGRAREVVLAEHWR
jgi:predicted protein tyrosine phosphatase